MPRPPKSKWLRTLEAFDAWYPTALDMLAHVLARPSATVTRMQLRAILQRYPAEISTNREFPSPIETGPLRWDIRDVRVWLEKHREFLANAENLPVREKSPPTPRKNAKERRILRLQAEIQECRDELEHIANTYTVLHPTMVVQKSDTERKLARLQTEIRQLEAAPKKSPLTQ